MSQHRTLTWDLQNTQHGGLMQWAEKSGLRIPTSIVEGYRRWGKVSDKQIDLLLRLRQQAEDDALHAPTKSLTETVVYRSRLQVLATKDTTSKYGKPQVKMVARLLDGDLAGNKVWVAACVGKVDYQRGETTEAAWFKITPSNDDPNFGWANETTESITMGGV